MECKCGGSTEDEHRVVRNKQLVAKYQRCPACKRVLFTWFKQGWTQEKLKGIRQRKNTVAT